MSTRISVVVPVLNMAGTVGSCLKALTTQTYPASLTQILVVDNGSHDDTPRIVARYPVVLLHEPRAGAPSARNRGIEAATGDLIAFTDADCVPTRGWLAEIVKTYEAEHATVVAGPLAPVDPEASAIAAYSASIGQYDPSKTLFHPRFPYAVTANVAFHRTVFERVGLFDPAYTTFDSAELFQRIRAAGLLAAAVARRALVFYRTRRTVRAFVRQNYGYGAGFARLCRATGARDAVAPQRVIAEWARRLPDGLALLRDTRRPLSRRLALVGLHGLRETALAAGRLVAR